MYLSKMKVNYLPKNRLKNSHLKLILILIVIFLLAIFAFTFLDKVIISIASPIWKSENILVRNLQNGFNFFNSQQALFEENIALKEKISSLELELLSLSKNGLQQETFFELIGRERTANTVVAAVLTHPPQTPYDIIIIDAGTLDSINIDGKVFLPEGPYLGKVIEVFSNKAKVKLLSSSGEETDAILERGSIPVKLIGTGGGNFKIAIPQDIIIENGDRIISADIQGNLMAVVGKINISPTDSFKEILAHSPINIFNLRFVFVTPQ